jgi:hypothetical protein
MVTKKRKQCCHLRKEYCFSEPLNVKHYGGAFQVCHDNFRPNIRQGDETYIYPWRCYKLDDTVLINSVVQLVEISSQQVTSL